MDFKKAILEVREKTSKRKFIQSIDLVVNFKNIDFNKPENRLNLEIQLPHGRGRKVRIAAIVGDALINEAKIKSEKVIRGEEIPELAANKSALKKLVSEYDFFLAQTDYMASIGKHLGQVLGPRDKMPYPVPPTAKLEPFMKRLENLIKIKVKGKFMPTVHATVGTEEMKDEQIVENASKVLESIIEKVPDKEGNIKSVFLKMSMGPAVKVN